MRQHLQRHVADKFSQKLRFFKGLVSQPRTVGAIAGSAISIAYLLPDNRREAALRFASGIAIGMIFGTIAGHKIAAELALADQLGPVEITLIGATTASLCAWWAIGAVVRVATRFGVRNG